MTDDYVSLDFFAFEKKFKILSKLAQACGWSY